MRLTRLRIASMIAGLFLSVAAYAAPIDIGSIEFTVQAVDTDYSVNEDTSMTTNDFIVAAPYVVTLDVATHVPIKQKSLALLETQSHSDNLAVMQNSNFERYLS